MANVLVDTDKLRKIVGYVGQTQPILEKVAAQSSELSARIPGVVDTLVTRGLLSPHLKAAKVKELEGNPIGILELLDKTAALVVAKAVGSGSDEIMTKVKSANQVFEDRLMGNG